MLTPADDAAADDAPVRLTVVTERGRWFDPEPEHANAG
jgi:hypothetical protein